MYCAECQKVFAGKVCTGCGNDQTRPPLPTDDCFLVETEMLVGEILAEVLRREKIPYYFKTMFGAGVTMRIGPYCEVYRFYVPYSHLALASQHAEVICPQKEKT